MENTEKGNNLREAYLQKCVDRNATVTIFMCNGFQMRGVITGFDESVFIVKTDGVEKMLNNSAVSTVAAYFQNQSRAYAPLAPWSDNLRDAYPAQEQNPPRGFLPND